MKSVLLAFGSNLGDRRQTLENAYIEIGKLPDTELVCVSGLYETKPVGGPVGQPDYLNAAGIIKTRSSPQELLKQLQAIELQFGRIRKERWGARTLDIDILLYENEVIETPKLIIPHKEMLNREFVLLPAGEIAPDWIHPVSNLTIRQHFELLC
ncbi:MAG: 2-amino-4-hydroxy-6-hydroxymethyldihydropteridine diphosphokinase [Planctomycetaceae bacterium]|nr:2-amino-4-hydroxy-6-hydroxymethyldihydropteridine diphosphokinase [Planctomycetaceae bacterium]